MPLNSFIVGMVNILFAWYAKCPFTNRKIGFNILAEITNTGIITFLGYIVAIRPKDNEIGVGRFLELIDIR